MVFVLDTNYKYIRIIQRLDGYTYRKEGMKLA
ncbi:hypothetical protein HNQ34_003089 [Anoxybacillus tepidamans]|uniref:Uncharacterized protein n=1 Tax=Anoxybacteroides tepidamans TaxID=265948 RepID=A0A7W8IST2_9BACL|nr:hypothetical protein [Anoxybacillus tepidamans]